MLKCLVYLAIYIPVQLVAYLITPVLPLFATLRDGNFDNANKTGEALRLPLWMAWFDTPDNSIWGDNNWLLAHPKGTYWNQVAWLYRNSLYGFKWSVLAMPIQQERNVYGDIAINHHTKHCGAFYISQANGAWQFKMVMPWNDGYSVLNFGWLLDDPSQEKALFMFSPRVKKTKGVLHDG